MKLKFSKMHGLGNDFMVIDGVRQSVTLDPDLIRQWGDRHFGIGFDQLLLVQPPESAENDFRYLIYNNDGSLVEQCGNGARCFVRFVVEQQLTTRHRIRVETAKGVIFPSLQDNGLVTVDMGQPRLQPAEIPFVAQQQQVCHALEVNGTSIALTVVSMGNPHAVMTVADTETADVAGIGAALQQHPAFPLRVNAGFMQYLSRSEIRLRVYERGAGETLACGTGACAAVVAGILRGELDSPVRVHTHGGDLTIKWDGVGQPVLMTGPAVTVFTGEIEI
jgi:diaminopimelate epimerase